MHLIFTSQYVYVGPQKCTGPVLELGPHFRPVLELGRRQPRCGTVQLGLRLGIGLDSQFRNGAPCSSTGRPMVARCHNGAVGVPVPARAKMQSQFQHGVGAFWGPNIYTTIMYITLISFHFDDVYALIHLRDKKQS